MTTGELTYYAAAFCKKGYIWKSSDSLNTSSLSNKRKYEPFVNSVMYFFSYINNKNIFCILARRKPVLLQYNEEYYQLS